MVVQYHHGVWWCCLVSPFIYSLIHSFTRSPTHSLPVSPISLRRQKFNHISPGVYAKFAAVLRKDVLTCRADDVILDHTHSITQRLGLAPLPLATILVRLLVMMAKKDESNSRQTMHTAVLLVLVFFNLLVFKVRPGLSIGFARSRSYGVACVAVVVVVVVVSCNRPLYSSNTQPDSSLQGAAWYVDHRTRRAEAGQSRGSPGGVATGAGPTSSGDAAAVPGPHFGSTEQDSQIFAGEVKDPNVMRERWWWWGGVGGGG